MKTRFENTEIAQIQRLHDSEIIQMQNKFKKILTLFPSIIVMNDLYSLLLCYLIEINSLSLVKFVSNLTIFNYFGI